MKVQKAFDPFTLRSQEQTSNLHFTNITLRFAQNRELLDMDPSDTYRYVQDRYAEVAGQINPRNQIDHERKVAGAFGYTLEDLRSIPEGANLGVSCGNPLATANIAEVGMIPVADEHEF